MRTFKHDGKENEVALSFPLFFMVGVIEMCGLLMIALPARESHICEAGGQREKQEGARSAGEWEQIFKFAN